MPKKRGKKLLIIFSILILILLIITAYFLFFNNSSNNFISLKNPVIDISDEQAVNIFNESFVRYLLYSIDADELHKSPIKRETPKINFYIGEKTYFAEVSSGIISVKKGLSQNPDISLKTTTEEAVKMLRNKAYIVESFNSGKSSFETHKEETTLFAKGYLNIYENFS